MNNHTITEYFLNKPYTCVSHPFGEQVDVFKVKDKMFATLSLGSGNEKGTNGRMKGHYCINLKCDPDEALALRDIFDAVIPGYHMNKKLWNTIILDGSMPKGEIERLIDNSYSLVVSKMTKKEREIIALQM
ncbi:MmcQ/YjbR family DNA-binding protein [Pseudoalteromonas sp.]|uniref:MmcQ/YjbR family DNA-binding protein n=1 Tax=Pseudoalteromonas sp. TaxID=53249 RepID=UPI0035625898